MKVFEHTHNNVTVRQITKPSKTNPSSRYHVYHYEIQINQIIGRMRQPGLKLTRRAFNNLHTDSCDIPKWKFSWKEVYASQNVKDAVAVFKRKLKLHNYSKKPLDFL